MLTSGVKYSGSLHRQRLSGLFYSHTSTLLQYRYYHLVEGYSTGPRELHEVVHDIIIEDVGMVLYPLWSTVLYCIEFNPKRDFVQYQARGGKRGWWVFLLERVGRSRPQGTEKGPQGYIVLL